MKTIPFENADSFRTAVTLSNNAYILRFDWNTRAGFWTMDICDYKDTPLVQGLRLVIGYPLTYNHPQVALPPGIFFCVEYTGKLKDIEKNSFIKGEVDLLYIEGAELA